MLKSWTSGRFLRESIHPRRAAEGHNRRQQHHIAKSALPEVISEQQHTAS